MWKGCLFLAVLLAASVYAEWNLIEQRGLPNPAVLSIVLALGLTLAFGSVWGLVDAVRKSSSSPADWNSLQDGQQVRLCGILRPEGRALAAPFSGREVLLCEYRAFQALRIGSELADRYPASFRGIDMAPCVLETATGLMPLRGFPFLKHFPEDSFGDQEPLAKASRLLASVHWRPSDRLGTDFEAYGQLLSNSDGQLPLHVINDRAREKLLSPAGEPAAGRWRGGPPPSLEGEAAEKAIQERLRQGGWSFRERVVLPQAEVTVDGTYRSTPPRVEMQSSIGSAHHAIRPGLSAKIAVAEIVTAAVFLIVIAGLTGVAHYAVYAEEGARYLHFVNWLKEFA